MIDRRTGKFHVVIAGKYGLQLICGGRIFLCVKTESQPPDMPLCDRCRRKVSHKLLPVGERWVRSRNMLSGIATVIPGALRNKGPKPVKPLPGQKELF